MAWSTLRDLVCVSNCKTRVCQKAFLRSSLVGLGRNSSSLSFPLSFITPDRSVEFWWNWSRKWRMRSFFKGGYNLYVIAFTLQEETGNLLEITVLPNPVRKLLRNYALSSYFTNKRYQIAIHLLLYFISFYFHTSNWNEKLRIPIPNFSYLVRTVSENIFQC